MPGKWQNAVLPYRIVAPDARRSADSEAQGRSGGLQRSHAQASGASEAKSFHAVTHARVAQAFQAFR